MAVAMIAMTRNPVFAMLPLMGALGILAPKLAGKANRRSAIDLDGARLLEALEGPQPTEARGKGLTLAPWGQVLLPGSTVELAGPAGPELAAAWIAVHLALHGPGSIRVILRGPAAGWSWTRWLAPTSQALTVVIDTDPTTLAGPAPPDAVVIDLAAKPTDQASLLIEARHRTAGLIGARLDGGTPQLIVPLGEHTAQDTARRDAQAVHAGPQDLATALPIADIHDRWAQRGLTVPVGVDHHGNLVTLDLPVDGPHLLVAGATGSGKSEFLRSLMLGCALAASPKDLTIVGIDHKGGSTFADLADLPHLAAVVTDLDVEASRRAIVSLGAELERRERLLEERGLTSLAALDPADAPPRLLVVIDEFRALIETMPNAAGQLERLGAQGRSLGMHLVLATQRPAGAVSSQLRANLALRICFRVAQEADSLDVISSPLAARIDPDRPGTAYLASAGRETMAMRALLACGPTPQPARERAWPSRWDAPAPGAIPPPDILVRAIASTAAHQEIGPAPSPWRPELPTSLPLADLGTRSDATGPFAIGLSDIPERLLQQPLLLNPAEGNLLVIGARRSGRTMAARTVAISALARRWHVHVLTSDVDAFGDLTDHPCFGTLASPTQPRLVARLLTLLAEGNAGVAHTLLVVDDAQALGSMTLPGSLDHPLEAISSAGEGLWVVATCLARHASARWTAHFPVRLALATVDRTEDVAAGVPPGLAGTRTNPGRVAVLKTGEEHLAQLALATREDAFGLNPDDAAGWGEAADPTSWALPQPSPVRLRPVPEAVACLPDPQPDWLWLGVGGDLGEPLGLALRPGATIGIVGPPGSGRTAVLRAIHDQLVQAGGPPPVWISGQDPDAWTQATETLSDGSVALLDDADQAGTPPTMVPSSGSLIITASTRVAAGFSGIGPVIRAQGLGVLLWSNSASSGDAFGMRQGDVADPGAPKVPGRGVLVTPRDVQPIQCALRQTP